MRGRSIALWLAAMAGGTGAGGAGLPGMAMAHAATNPFVQMGAQTQSPRGFTEMCGARPALCASFEGQGEGRGPARPTDGALENAMHKTLLSPPWQWAGVIAPHIACGSGSFAMIVTICRIELLPQGREPASWPLSRGGLADLHQPALAIPLSALTGRVMPGDGAPGWTRGEVRALVLPALLAAPYSPPAFPTLPEAGDHRAVPEGAGVKPVAAPEKLVDQSALWHKLLARVNAHVNARVYQQSDLATYGVPELWRPSGAGSGAVGDCEDLALEKRVELLASHFPPERLFLAVVYRRDAGLHTVLVARLEGGDVLLDSRVDFIEPWDRAGYNWVSVEAPGRPAEWREAV